MAMIHSLKETREVEIIQQLDANHVIAEYGERHFTAIDNPFSGLIYVDDIYGAVPSDFRYPT